MKYRVQLICFNAGGGHKSAALALQEIIDSDRYFQKLTGFASEDF